MSGLMTSYNAINGTPSPANTYTADDIAHDLAVVKNVSDRVAVTEGLVIPDTVPIDLAASLDGGVDAGWARTRAELAPIG